MKGWRREWTHAPGSRGGDGPDPFLLPASQAQGGDLDHPRSRLWAVQGRCGHVRAGLVPAQPFPRGPAQIRGPAGLHAHWPMIKKQVKAILYFEKALGTAVTGLKKKRRMKAMI